VSGETCGDLIEYSLSTTAEQCSNVGTYPIVVTLVGGNDNYNISVTGATLTVNPYKVCAQYNGSVFVNTDNPDDATAEVTVSITVLADVACDYLSSANVSVEFDSDPSNVTISPSNTTLVDQNSGPGIHTLSKVFTVDLGANPSANITVTWNISGNYTNVGCEENDAVITVAKAADEYVTGGGYLISENSHGDYAADDGKKNNFGFNVGWAKNYSRLKGNVNIIWRQDGIAYQARTNTVSALLISQITAEPPVYKAQIEYSNVNIKQLCDEGCWSDGNGTILLTVYDYGEPGSNAAPEPDKIGIAVKDKNGNLIFSSDAFVSQEITVQDLDGGNIQIHPAKTSTTETSVTKGGGRKAAYIESPTSESVESATLTVYPNPFSEKALFEFVSPVAGQARIDIYDLNGRLVKTIFDQQIESNVTYQADFIPSGLVSGTYIYRMILGNEVFNGKLNYQQ